MYKYLNFIIDEISFYYWSIYHKFFNKIIKKQNLDEKTIPIIIISYNQLFYLEKLIDFLLKYNYTNIIIIDNNSTYKPLLDYFEIIEHAIKVHRLDENYGHLVFWRNKELFDRYSKGYYVVTDADIVPEENCPKDFLLYFKKVLDENSKITKVGFSLNIENIPEANPNKVKIINWESMFWNRKTKDENFISPIDTTFALYRPSYKYKHSTFYHAIRAKKPYQAVHGGWYIDIGNLTEEQLFYFSTCNESSSWRIDINGDVIRTIYSK